MSYDSEVLADSPVAYWKLAEASGSAAADTSGNGHGGTFTNVVLGQASLVTTDAATSTKFNASGSGTVIPASSAFAIAANADFSISAWIKVPVTAGSPSMIMGTLLGNAWWLGCYQDKLSTSISAVIFQTVATINTNAAMHVALVRRSTELYFYVNNVETQPTDDPAEGGALGDAGNAIGVGSTEALGYSWANGWLQNVAFFNTGLSAARINAHYTAGTGGGGGALTAGAISITTPATSTTVGLTVTEATGGTGPYTRLWHRSTTTGFTPDASNDLPGETGLTLSDTGLAPSTDYFYKVVQTDSVAASVTTAQQAVTTTAAVATSYALVGPTSGTVNAASTNFTVTPNGTTSGTVTPASTGAGTFSPASLTWTGDAVAKTFTYTPTSIAGSPHGISITSSPVLAYTGTPIAYTVNPATATSYALTGPSSGSVNVASTNFTVTPNGATSGTVTPASDGAGTFNPASLTWTGDAVAKTFTYTPTSEAGSPHDVSITSDPALSYTGSPVAYTVNAGVRTFLLLSS